MPKIFLLLFTRGPVNEGYSFVWFTQSHTPSLRSLLHRLDKTSGSLKFRYRINFDWFKIQCKRPEVKHQRVRYVLHLKERQAQFSPEVRYFRTLNRNFPGSLVSRPLIKGSEDPGNEGGLPTNQIFGGKSKVDRGRDY